MDTHTRTCANAHTHTLSTKLELELIPGTREGLKAASEPLRYKQVRELPLPLPPHLPPPSQPSSAPRRDELEESSLAKQPC